MTTASLSKQSSLTVAELRDALAYDAETGIFRWRHDRASTARAGQIAGSPCHPRGYRFIRVNYSRFLAHRLAWFYVYGEWPAGEVDHVNGKTDDNSIKNLRLATRQQNVWNGAAKSNNAFGMRNIRPKGSAFFVHFSRGNKRIFNKSYPTLEAAVAVRNSMAVSLHGEFNSVQR